uniref:Uncharacterized protein n=1 Tax=Hyaloperonospora arabidopsidis (strain Emoy2) TaxID=559515 RepID=M4B691_HYAAE
MDKSRYRNLTIGEEFASLAKVLMLTADDAAKCLKALKTKLSEFDSLHHNHLLTGAKTYMQSDIRKAKYTSAELRSVAQQIHKNHYKPSKTGVKAAYSMMNSTAKSMGLLVVTAHNYDTKAEHQLRRIKGADEVAADHKGDKGDQCDGRDNQAGYCSGNDTLQHSDDTVEMLVRTTLRHNFSLNDLSYQASAAETALMSFTIVDRAKEVVHVVKDKLKGKASPTYNTHRSVTPLMDI